MNLHRIETVQDLKGYLACAIQLEHATIPPYLMALYSIKDTTSEAFHVIRVVVVEEMLHMSLAANMLNAIGGTPDVLADGFVPVYPAYLPDGETDFTVSLQKFSPEALELFLKIEMPRDARAGIKSEERLRSCQTAPLRVCALAFKTIGDFYAEILRGFLELNDKLGADALFCGDPDRQIPEKYFYSGGGKLTPVRDITDVEEAVRLISEQGEGYGETIFGRDQRELAHYFRFMQLKHGRRYVKEDRHTRVPSGQAVAVSFDDVFPIITDAKWSDYSEGTGLRAGVLDFARSYRRLLEVINEAFNGNPSRLTYAMSHMSEIRDKALAIMHHPMPGDPAKRAAPIFALPAAAPAPPRQPAGPTSC